jgi:hypothetical protein
VAEITVTGDPAELNDAVRLLAEREEQRQREVEQELDAAAKQMEQEQQEAEVAVEEVVVQEMEEDKEMNEELVKAIGDLKDTLVSRLDDLKPADKVAAERKARAAQLRAELAELEPNDETDDEEDEREVRPSPAKPATPPRKTTPKSAGEKPGNDDAGEGEKEKPARKWYSWN